MQTMPYIKRSTCRLCDSRKLDNVISFPATPIGECYVNEQMLSETQDEFPLSLAFCESCGAFQLLDVVSPQLLYGDYGNFKYETSISLGLPEHFESYAKEVVAFLKPKPGSLVLDIGSNDGTLLKSFQKLGLKVLGVDPAPEASRKANAAGVETMTDYFDGRLAEVIKEKYGVPAIIVSNNTIANIDDLSSFVKSVRSLMNDDAYFVFETGYIVDLVKKRLIDVIYHEHLSYFSVKTLKMFFEKHNMEMIHAKYIPTKGGSIRCMIQIKKGKRRADPSVAEMIGEEESWGVDKSKFYSDLNIFVKQNKADLLQKIKNIKAQGKTISGYGASVGVTTLIYHYGVGEYLDVLFDDNPIKHGLYSPGHHIPVVPSHEIYKRRPDYILCFAWRYKDAIRKKHQIFFENGGHFIVPLPEVEII